MKGLQTVAWVLLVIGGLNWGLMGVGLGNVVESILGSGISMIVYILVGLSALYSLFTYKKQSGGAAM
ncbi:MAG TPA: DUF378 domain-containing protein [Candidatus Paceibacterota bacterium]